MAIRICTCSQDPRWAINVLINFAVTHTRLEKFSHFTSAEQADLRPFITQGVMNLRKLSLSYWIDRRSPLVPILVKIIGKNPALSCLELDNGANDKSNESFNTLLSGIPDDASLPLSRLVLGSLMSPSMIGWWIISVPSQSCDWASYFLRHQRQKTYSRYLDCSSHQFNISEDYLNP